MAAAELSTETPTRRAVWTHLAALVAGVVIATLAAVAITTGKESGVEVGETFTARVKSYFGPEGPQPNVICFDRDLNCGLPILGREEMQLAAGTTVTATEILLDAGAGEQRLAFYVHPGE